MMKTALITGASSGIGLDLARQFARDKWNLVLVARTEARLSAVAADLEREHGISATVIAIDLAIPGAPQQVVGRLTDSGIEIEALVNNAGFGLAGPFVELDLDRQLEMIALNATALTHLTGLIVPAMIRRGSGQILNVASTAAFQPGPLMAVYYATKAYVLSFSEALRNELRGTGVSVTTFCPGPTETRFAAAANMESSRLFNLMRPMSSAKAARIGYLAMKRRRGIVVAGLHNRLLAASVRFSPRFMTMYLVRKLQESYM